VSRPIPEHLLRFAEVCPCRMDTSNHRRFGRYEILDEIGRGAMGVVYRARDPKINRTVAIKTISLANQSPDAQREFRERFRCEAEAAGRLSHPGIVTIFDVGEEPDTHDLYLVMECVNGTSLDKVLEDNGRLAPDDAVRLASELAEALDCAHGQNVVHRDLKPANILITDDGHAKIADFGIAQLNVDNLTAHGQVWGTPAFMSPEQLNDEPVDGRSDLFSLGVILYMLLTGHRPFQGNSPLTISLRVVSHEPVPAIAFDPDLPLGLDYVLERALAKNPVERYQRGMEMSLDLQNILTGHEPWGETTQQTAKLPSRSRFDRVPAKRSIARGFGIHAPQKRWRNFGELYRRMVRETRKTWLAFPLLRPLPFLLLGVALYGVGRQIPSVSTKSPDRTQAVTPPPTVPSPTPAESVGASPTRAETIVPSPARLRASSAPISPTRAAMVNIQVENQIPQGNVTIWVDERAVYRRLLPDAPKKKLGIFGSGHKQESEKVQIASGEHQLRVRVQSRNPFYDQSHALAGDFPVGSERVLRVSFDKHNEIHASLK
jgi:serine/threonine protein kinase